MYCSNCGNQIDDNAVVCPECGCPTKNFSKNSKSTHANSSDAKELLDKANTLSLISIIGGIFIPLLGWICGGIGIGNCNTAEREDPARAADIKQKCIIGIIVSSVVFLISAGLFLSVM